jgi:hypothetical protein
MKSFGALFLVFAAAVIAVAAPLQNGSYRVRFREDLKATDMRLSGHSDSRVVRFFSESRWAPRPGSSIHLFIRHSRAIDPMRSFLSVTLNYAVLRSLRLGEQNGWTEVVVPVPANLLRFDNELVLNVEQSGGSDDFVELWTEVGAQSFIAISYDTEQPQLKLGLLPSPLVDPYSYRQQKLNVLLAEQSSIPTLEAAAVLVANICRQTTQPPAIQIIRSSAAANDPVVVVGAFRELPRLPASARRDRLKGPGNVLAGLTTIERVSAPMLFMTAEDSKSLLPGIHRLLSTDFEDSVRFAELSGTSSPWAAKERRDWAGFMPSASRFTLQDLGLGEVPLTRESGFSAIVALDAQPDTRFLGYGHYMSLTLKLADPAYAADANLDVFLNDKHLGDFALNELTTGSITTVSMRVPADLLQPRNRLKVVWRSNRGVGKNLVGWLLRTSEFYFPRNYRARLPDLALLQFGFYPFSLRPDLSDTILLTPSNPGPEMHGAALQFACSLGRMLPTDRVNFRLRTVPQLTAQEKAGSNFVYLSGRSPEESPDRIFPQWKRMPPVTSRGAAAVQEARSPWNSERHVIAITASSTALLADGINQLFSETTLRALNGDAAYLTRQGPRTMRLEPVREYSESSVLTSIHALLRANWMALPLILVFTSGLLFVALRLVLKARKQVRPQPID